MGSTDRQGSPGAPAGTAPERGLGDAQVRAARERGDGNAIPEPTSRSALAIVRANVLTRFNALLGALFVLMLALGPWQDALFGGVIVINTLIGIAQELRARRALERLVVLSRAKVKVLRGDRTLDLDPTEIVREDVLVLATGDQVPVDALVLSGEELALDESLLTGEAEPVPRHVGDEILSGSLVVSGRTLCRATRVGAAAQVHRLTAQAASFRVARSELRAGIDRLLRYVTWAIVPVGSLLVASQLGLRLPLREALRFSAGALVAMVPEGLVLLASAALALGAIRLARGRTLVQDLPATETLARIDTLCLDKSGTLTERAPELERIEWLGDEALGRRALAALAAADARPNATLQAIARDCGASQDAVEEAVAFSSSRKWAGARIRSLGTWLLGAPDVLLAAEGDDPTLTRSRELAAAGHRVLLLAQAKGGLQADRPPEALRAVGLVVLAERLRPDAQRTLRYFREQGIALRLISGDHPATVGQVAQRLGLDGDQAPADARELPADAASLAAMLSKSAVIGRATPEHKRSIVAALQAQGHVVGMFGDGANDILALKQADVGIAMGSGSGAARAVAHLVLLDDAFERLPTVVDEGRRVVGNVERVAALFMTKTVYAMLLALVVGLADVAFPFLPRHLTLIGALTIGIPGFLLALQRGAEPVRPGFVARVLRLAAPAGLVAATASFATYSVLAAVLQASPAQARTGAAVALFAIAIWIVGMVARPFTVLRTAMLAAICTTFAVTLRIAPAREFFALQPLAWPMWAATAAIVAAAGALAWRSVVLLGREARPPAASRRLSWREMLAWLLSHESPKWFVASAAALVLGGAWLFLGVLEDVVSQDPLVAVDTSVHGWVQALRTPLGDRVATAFTEFGDVQVVLPVALVAMGWFVARRWSRTAAYWLAALGVAEALVKLIKLTLHRPRPAAAYAGVEQFSFPSSHATLSVVAYGFLAFLVTAEMPRRRRLVVLGVVAGLIGAIALSRVYLGVHWMSDVIGGLSFGTAWVAALAIAYTYQGHEVRGRGLAVACLAAFVVAAGVHVATSLVVDGQQHSRTRQSRWIAVPRALGPPPAIPVPPAIQQQTTSDAS